MFELPTEPTEPELLDQEVSQIIAFNKHYKAAFMRGIPDDWDGPLGQAAQMALNLQEENPLLLIRVGYLNALLELKGDQKQGIPTTETRQSLREAFFG